MSRDSLLPWSADWSERNEHDSFDISMSRTTQSGNRFDVFTFPGNRCVITIDDEPIPMDFNGPDAACRVCNLLADELGGWRK